MKPPNTGEFAWDDEDKEWLAQTVRYYVSSMSVEQREERGITADKARLLLKGQVQRALPLPLVQGCRQLTNGVLPTPLPQGTRAAARAPRKRFAIHTRRTVRTPAAPPPHGPHPRRTPAARPAPPPHPRRTVRTPAAPPPHGPHPLRSAGGGGTGSTHVWEGAPYAWEC